MTIKVVTKLNAEMLTLARESRGLTQCELARDAKMAQATLSKYENGLLDSSTDHICALASALGYPVSLLTHEMRPQPMGSVCMFHRKRETTSVKDARRVRAIITLGWLQIQGLLRGIEIQAPVEFPQFEVGEHGIPDQIAQLVRLTWRLPSGPIKNLVATIERAGGIVLSFNFGTRKMDAMSLWSQTMPALFFVNSVMPADRIRWSLAHELGHVVMHRGARPNQEEEADAFASEFLMPARDIKSDLWEFNLALAAQLKPVWKVSMQALIRRAYNLRQITENQYRRLFTQLSKLGYRSNEPNTIPDEQPQLVEKLISVHQHDHGYSIKDLAEITYLLPSEFQDAYLPHRFIHELNTA